MNRRGFLKGLAAATALCAVPEAIKAAAAAPKPAPTVVPPLMRLQASDDGVTWRTIREFTAPDPSRYWRINIESPSGEIPGAWDISEREPRWIGYDFAEPVAISEIELRAR